MKIRSGFVSNSSSSSFILAYDKTDVLTNPKDIVDYISNHLRTNILFKSDLCDGYDVFELDMKQKNFLLKHKKRFIQYNHDPVTVTDWDAEVEPGESLPEIEVPSVIAYPGVFSFYPYPYEYKTPEVDISDIEDISITNEEIIESMKDTASDELKEKVKKANDIYRILNEREREAYKKQKEDYIEEVRQSLIKKGVNSENLIVELIDVDNRSCDPDGFYDSEFAPRYFGLDENLYYEETGDPDLEDEVE